MRADITEKKAAEATVARLAAIVASTSDAIISKGQSSAIETWNEGAERLYGYAALEMIGAPAATIVPADLIEEERELLAQVWRGERVNALETIRVGKEGQRIDVSITASPIRMPSGEIVGVSSIARDISQRKRDERALQASLREKDVLLAEVHHRVKNNLQIVVSLLKLHAEKISDPTAVAAFEDGQTRVHSIALLHEMLYHSKDLHAVTVADYALSLANALLRTYANCDVRFVVAADGVLLDLDDAVPFGMILNELVTNSLKHAFAGAAVAAPEVRVEVRATADEIALVVSDNGAGFPPGFDAGACDSLGMHIMLALSGQLGGTIQFEAGEGGATARLAFPNSRGKNVG
jgi:two-component system, sensor histidine kinase PdtaS